MTLKKKVTMRKIFKNPDQAYSFFCSPELNESMTSKMLVSIIHDFNFSNNPNPIHVLHLIVTVKSSHPKLVSGRVPIVSNIVITYRSSG